MSSLNFTPTGPDMTLLNTPIGNPNYSQQGYGMEERAPVDAHSSRRVAFNIGTLTPANQTSTASNAAHTYAHNSPSPEQTNSPRQNAFNMSTSGTQSPALTQPHFPNSPSNPTVAPGVTIFIDGLAKDFRLEPQQRANLHLFVKVRVYKNL